MVKDDDKKDKDDDEEDNDKEDNDEEDNDEGGYDEGKGDEDMVYIKDKEEHKLYKYGDEKRIWFFGLFEIRPFLW